MKGITGILLYIVLLVCGYFVNLFFFLHRQWLPNADGFVQSEFDYLLQELSNGNPAAYLILLMDLLLAIGFVYGCSKLIKHKFHKN